MARQGDARTAAEKAADRLVKVTASGRRFSLTGAWAGNDWICNCRGRLNHGDKPDCARCALKRPGMRHWLAQSVRWGEIATREHVDAARAYVSEALFCGVFHGGVDAVGYRLLLETVARERGIPVEKLQ